MQVAYQLQGDELNISFLESVKSLFKNKEIEIIIHDIDAEDTKFGAILDYSFVHSQRVSEDTLLKDLRYFIE